ncbi:aminopeptidase [Dialister pneumosintes]|uniref:M18 family aminopeptidase n=1 Tax=Dialister pneumosintes TaxID=39950 RepID=A0ABX9MBM8_9FIRM|nr:aminopeptidase [Dialister pneumosintes]MBS6480244.1 aminopeptidase [Dialister sp.]RID94724.1 aminopeptidase [Dialister pneumosintes]
MKETYSRTKTVWQRMNEEERKATMAYGEDYKEFLDIARTERLAVTEIVKQAEAAGFIPLYDCKELKAGDKVYWNQKGKSVVMAVIGEKPVHDGIKIVGSHLDTPRLDLKGNPVRESDGIVYFRTHYYGGIKKYQWTCVPLALIGVIYTKSGKKVEINIGMKDEDPIFYISDLLIHMAQDQMKKTLAQGITGEQLQAICATHSEENMQAKEVLLKFFKDTYDIEEEDFATAELELVPAMKSRDVGFDRSLIASYGQDDRVCSYANLRAILEAKPGMYTQAALLTDKEEIGSYGNTGMESSYFVKVIMKMLALQGHTSLLDFYEAMENSEMLSADVNSCLDPMFPEVTEKDNSSLLGHGIALTKYTGSRGKSGSNDANAEFMNKVRNIFNKAGVAWQIGELGKVDQGGGGTIAFMMANWGCEVVDCGTSMLSMHSPYDLLSKADAYQTFLAYKAFFESE